MNPHAQALGRLGRGHPKRISLAESERRRQSLALARQKRRPMQTFTITPQDTPGICSACGKAVPVDCWGVCKECG